MVAGRRSPLSLAIDSELLAARLRGRGQQWRRARRAGGLATLVVASIRELAAWLAEPIAFEGEGLRKLTIKASSTGSPERVAFTDATIGLDAIEGQGELIAELAGAVPKINGRLDLGAVDLDPYLPPRRRAERPAAPASGQRRAAPGRAQRAGGRPRRAAAGGWSDEPIALPPLGGAEVDFELTVDCAHRCAGSSSAPPCSA